MPLDIAYGLPFYDPATQFGGPIAQVRELSERLSARGHRVSVVTTDVGVGPDLPRDRWVERDGYRVWYAHGGRLGSVAPYYARRLRAPLDQVAAECDVLHLALSFTHLGVLARRAAAAHGTPFVYAPRACLCPDRLALRPWLKRAFLALFERRIIADAAVVHALTEAEREQVLVQGADPRAVRVITNGATLAERATWPDGAAFRRRLGIDERTPLVLHLGRLQKIKGLDVLVDVFARAKRRVPDAVLAVVGPDEGGVAIVEEHAAKHGVRDAVFLTGHLDGEDKIDAYRAGDLFLLTSFSEGLPNVVLEACSCGTPVLITDRCHVPEVAEHGAGRVEPLDAGRLGDALADMLADPAALARMGENASALAQQRFRFDALVERLERLYEELRDRAPAAR